MRVSTFVIFTLYLTSQAESICVNVNQNDNGTTSLRLRGSGQTCGDFPLIVSKSGFQFKVYTSPKSTTPLQGSLRMYFGDVAVPFSFVSGAAELSIFTSDDIYLGRAISGVTTIEIQSNGVGFVTPKSSEASIKIPPLEEFQRYHEDKVTIKVKIEWTNMNDDFVVELPNHTDDNASTPPMSTSSTPTSTVTVDFTENNETTTTVFDTPTSSAHENSNATSKVTWIIIAAVVGCIFVIIATAAVIGAVYITRRIRRKRSTTGLLATPTTRVTYPSNEIHRFNIPIDPKSKITDHGINFNDYLAVVPAYPEEIREFESAEKKKKDEMYLGFLERIQIAERTENKGSK